MANQKRNNKTDFITYDYIENYCAEHKQLDWLEAEALKEYPQKIYPKMTVFVEDENGESIAKTAPDKSKEPTIVNKPATFTHIKSAFITTFMPELKADKAVKKGETMLDKIRKRKAAEAAKNN